MPDPVPGFAADTAVNAVEPGRWSATVREGWDIAGNANGGYLLAIAARAMAGTADRPDPVTLTAHYLSPGRPGPVEVQAQVVKAGKRFTTVQATRANGSVCAADEPGVLRLRGPNVGPGYTDARRNAGPLVTSSLRCLRRLLFFRKGGKRPVR